LPLLQQKRARLIGDIYAVHEDARYGTAGLKRLLLHKVDEALFQRPSGFVLQLNG